MNDNERLYKMSEMASIAGVDKTKVWRYIRDKNIHARSKNGKALLYSEQDKNTVIKGIKGNDVHYANEEKNDDSELVNTLRDQVEILKSEVAQKNKEINKFQVLLDQQQQLNLTTNRQNEKLLDSHTDNTPQKGSESPNKDDADGLEPTEGNHKVEENKTTKKGFFDWLKRS